MTPEQPAGIGHNNPPIAEVVAELFAPHAERVRPWVEAAGRVPDIADPETADKAVSLAARLAKEVKDIDKVRADAKQPYLEASRAIDGYAKTIITDVDAARGAVTAKLNAWQSELGRRERIERERREAEERAWREEAARIEREAREAEERARREAEEARLREIEADPEHQRQAAAKRAELERQAREAEQRRVDAELAAQRAADEAEARRRQEAAAKPTQLRSEYGAVASQRTITEYEVADAAKLGLWLMKNNPEALSDALLKIAGPMAKAAKVKPGEDRIPGLRAVARTTTVVKGS